MHTVSLTSVRHEQLRLSGGWQVEPRPLDEAFRPGPFGPNATAIPDSAHLQPVLYPDNPFWGEHLRAINQQAWIYQRRFRRPVGRYERARLRFGAVDYSAQVWVDGDYVGGHEGGFTPFEVTLPPDEPGAESVLTVRVTAPWDARQPDGTYPIDHVKRGLVKGLYEHGEGVIPPDVNPIGIWRPVWLVLDQGVSIDHVRVRTRLDGDVDLALRVTNASGASWDGCLCLEIEAENHDGPGITFRRVLRLSPGQHIIEQTLNVPEPRWWWPWDHGAPDLYRLRASLYDRKAQIIGSRITTFGIRTVRLERSPERFTYWLNGRPVYVRGASYMPGVYLSQCDEGLLQHDVALARRANLNLLRAHVHVAPPEFYRLCDREGMLVWQDFELNWIQDDSAAFEERAVTLQREMIDLLDSHPSVITWACHNEPTMVFKRRHNLEQRPDPALYADAQRHDPTRPVFIASGQLDSDWKRGGDTHCYYGAIWSDRYTDLYAHEPRLCTEFGIETPASVETLRAYPTTWERLSHLEPQIEALWDYQAALIQYQVEHFRRLRSATCGGYVLFWLADLVPQVGCGVLDLCRAPKGGYDALRRASEPLLVMLEHDGRAPKAIWAINDTIQSHTGAVVRWEIDDASGRRLASGETTVDLAANASQYIMATEWSIAPEDCITVHLALYAASGKLLSANRYDRPFAPRRRPAGYPWKFDPVLGTKVFDRPGAPSLAGQSGSALIRRIPLRWRERGAEWVMRRHFALPLASSIARIVDLITGSA